MQTARRLRRMVALLVALATVVSVLAPGRALAGPPGRRIELERRREREAWSSPEEEYQRREIVRRGLEEGKAKARLDEIAARVRAVAEEQRQQQKFLELEKERRESERRARDEARDKAAEEEVNRIRVRTPAPLRSSGAPAASPPKIALRRAAPQRPAPPGYSKVVEEKVAALSRRLGEGHEALVMDAAVFEEARGRLDALAAVRRPATPATATIDFEEGFAVVHLKDHLEIIQVEVPPAKLDEPGHRAILEAALRSLPRLLGEDAARVSKLVWNEAGGRYEPTRVIAPRESRRERPVRVRVAVR